MYRGQAHTSLDMSGAVLIPQPSLSGLFSREQSFHHSRHRVGQSKEHMQGAQRASFELGTKHQDIYAEA